MERIFEVNIEIDGRKVRYSMDVDKLLLPNVKKGMAKDKLLMQKIRIEMCELAGIMFGPSTAGGPKEEVVGGKESSSD